MKTISIVIVVLVVAIGGWFLLRNPGSGANAVAPAPSGAGGAEKTGGAAKEKAPGFSLKDYSGNTVSLSDFAGKPVVINSWATWCPFCRQELPDFAAAQKEFGDKVTIVAIDRSESLGTAKGYTDRQGTTNGILFLLDPSDSFYKAIGGFSMPETIFVDAEGNIVEHARGPLTLEDMREKIGRIAQ